jgi:hypothetical protein
MQRLCFKTRKNGRTVQLVRHIYSPATQRSQTVTLGSFATDADPDDVQSDLRLRPSVVLDEYETRQVARWLSANGDTEAVRRRQELRERIARDVRAAVLAELAAKAGDGFDQAMNALDALATALPSMVEEARQRKANARTELRPRYLALVAASGRLLKAAQAVGVAKTAKRSSRQT